MQKPAWPSHIVTGALEQIVGRGLRLYAAIFLGIGGLMLTVAWQHGPQRLLDADEFATLTARHPGRVVESWQNVKWGNFSVNRVLLIVYTPLMQVTTRFNRLRTRHAFTDPGLPRKAAL